MHPSRIKFLELLAETSDTPAIVQPASTLLAFFVHRYLPTLKHGSHGHIDKFLTAIRKLWEFLRREPLLADLSHDTEKRLDTWLATDGSLGETTRYKYLRQLRTLWRSAARNDLATGPVVPLCTNTICVGTPTAQMPPWSLPELRQLLDAAALPSPRVACVPGSVWWSAFVLLILETEMRPADLLDATWGDIDAILAALSPVTRKALARLREFATDVPFPWPFDKNLRDKQTLFNRYRSLLGRAGLPAGRNHSFDRLRATGRNHTSEAIHATIAETIGVSIDGPLPPQPVEVNVELQGVPTLLEVFERAYRPMKLIGASSGTSRHYRIKLEQFGESLGRTATIEDLTELNLARYMQWLSDRKRTPATVNKARAQLVALWNFCAKRRLVDKFPDMPKMAEYRRVPTTWTPAEVGRILAECRKQQGTIADCPAALWWEGLILTVYDTGLRIGALLQTSAKNLNVATHRLLVNAENQKQKADQDFLLHDDTMAVLAKLPANRELLFPWDEARTNLWGRFANILKAAGLPAGRRDKFHKIRRTAATMAEASMGPGTATRLLGHSGPAVTELYLDRSRLPGNDIANRIPRPVAPKTAGGKEGAA